MAKDDGQDPGSDPNSGTDPKDGKGKANPKDDGKGGDDLTVPKSRFDEVSTRAQTAEAKLEEYEKAEEERKRKEAEEQGKFQELAEEEAEKRKQAEVQLRNERVTNALKQAALQAGVRDADDFVRIIGTDNVKVSEDGTVDASSVETIVSEAKEGKSYLFGQGDAAPNVGDGGNPADASGGAKTFKRSQLQDGKFFDEHRDEIMEAQRQGRIVDDIDG